MSKIRYTQMAKYIDDHIYTDNYDVEKVFDYLYKLARMLSWKRRFFSDASHYEPFSFYVATNVFNRLTNKKQFLPEDNPKKLDKIKGVLNLMKAIMYPMKVNYMHDYFQEIYQKDYISSEVEEIRDRKISQLYSNMNEELIKQDTLIYLSQLPNTLWYYLKDIVHTKDKIELKNIYLSCLITLLKSITLSNENKELLQRFGKEKYLDNIYEEERLNATTLWHLPQSQYNYITILTNKLKKLIANDIRELSQMHVPTQDLIETILFTQGEDVDDEY